MTNEEAIKKLKVVQAEFNGNWIDYGGINQAFEKAYQALEERPKGEWIKITKNGTIPVEYICSVCGRKIFDNYELSVPQSVYYPFCHCGADMRKGGAGNDT